MLNGLGTVQVKTNMEGDSAESRAYRLAHTILAVSDDAPLAIREQAVAFRNKIELACYKALKSAIDDERERIAGTLERAGQKGAAEIIRML